MKWSLHATIRKGGNENLPQSYAREGARRKRPEPSIGQKGALDDDDDVKKVSLIKIHGRFLLYDSKKEDIYV